MKLVSIPLSLPHSVALERLYKMDSAQYIAYLTTQSVWTLCSGQCSCVVGYKAFINALLFRNRLYLRYDVWTFKMKTSAMLGPLISTC
jgi:hypothetical protein